MKERDFFYWLQGAFELVGVTAINYSNIQVVKAHANLVRETQKIEIDRDGAAAPLGEAFTTIEKLIGDYEDYTAARPQVVVKMQTVLAAQFQHVIDPSFGGPEVQDKLNAAHSAGGPIIGGTGPNGEVYRC